MTKENKQSKVEVEAEAGRADKKQQQPVATEPIDPNPLYRQQPSTTAGSAIAGFFIGMLLKRVLKIILIIVGSFSGVLFIAIQIKPKQKWKGGKGEEDDKRLFQMEIVR